MIFAVLDPSPLTVCINCSFLHLYSITTRWKFCSIFIKGDLMHSACLAIVLFAKRSKFSFLVFWSTCAISLYKRSRSLCHLLMRTSSTSWWVPVKFKINVGHLVAGYGETELLVAEQTEQLSFTLHWNAVASELGYNTSLITKVAAMKARRVSF